MNITFITSECALIAKAGGLGDVVHGLSQQLAKNGHNIHLILPFYKEIIPSIIQKKIEEKNSFFIQDATKKKLIISYFFQFNHVKVTLLAPKKDSFFSRSNIYGYTDDVDRFIFFSWIAANFLSKTPQLHDLIHLHDWPTALIPRMIKHIQRKNKKFPIIKTLLTVHHFNYQGIGSPHLLQSLLFPQKVRKISSKKNNKSLNCLNEGILHADYISTVSPSYAQETLSTKKNISSTLILKKNFLGILNGIDQNIWNPSSDPFLTHNYSPVDIKSSPPFIAQKKQLKDQLRSKLNMSLGKTLLTGVVTRLATEKGLEFIKMALIKIIENQGQCIVLGSCTDKEILRRFQILSKHFAPSTNIRIILTYNEKLAHHIYAASDLFLMPSTTEPCGLAQMIAMNYGSIPFVKKTGGLKDSVEHLKNGFVFESESLERFSKEIDKIFSIYNSNAPLWAQIMKNGLTSTWGWPSATNKYEQLYKKILKKKPNPNAFYS
ncbi:glycogen/starch synthase [Candidatus Clavichlamydia salmonicola]|uniref:glycogen/starch synthase n=1 Tax=Candidatus Clavichlamydia salmonicola TaxID=469812 RepID=UPI001891AFB7|nr:glycogen/starch synthase [Candidatus Clavichlamydia salmonicola]